MRISVARKFSGQVTYTVCSGCGTVRYLLCGLAPPLSHFSCQTGPPLCGQVRGSRRLATVMAPIVLKVFIARAAVTKAIQVLTGVLVRSGVLSAVCITS